MEPAVGIILCVLTWGARWETNTPASLIADVVLLVAVILLHWRPWAALVLFIGYLIVVTLLDIPGITGLLCSGLFIYNWFKHQRESRWLIATFLPVLILTLWVLRFSWEDLLANLLFVTGITLFGGVTGVIAGKRLESERQVRQESAEALNATRLMMASELHDSVAQSQALVVMSLEGLAEDPRLPEELIPEVAETLKTSRLAAQELRAAMKALRDVDQDFGAMGRPIGLPLRDQWQQVLNALQDGGFDVESRFLLEGRLAPEVEHSLSRILGELVTNVVWHGCPGPCRVEIVRQGDHVSIQVVNDVAASPPPKSGGGHGLLGVQERIRLLGGTCSFVRRGEQWHASVKVPVRRD